MQSRPGDRAKPHFYIIFLFVIACAPKLEQLAENVIVQSNKRRKKIIKSETTKRRKQLILIILLNTFSVTFDLKPVLCEIYVPFFILVDNRRITLAPISLLFFSSLLFVTEACKAKKLQDAGGWLAGRKKTKKEQLKYKCNLKLIN